MKEVNQNVNIDYSGTQFSLLEGGLFGTQAYLSEQKLLSIEPKYSIPL
jgi:hypothetical protein